MNRRRLLSLVGSGLVIAGCIDRSGDADGEERENGPESDGTGGRTNPAGGEESPDPDGSDGIEEKVTGTAGNDSRGDGRDSDSDRNGSSGDGGVSDVDVREPPECDGSLQALPGPFDEVEYDRVGTAGGQMFELVADPGTVALGEELSVMLRWISGGDDASPVTGNAEKFTIEREAGDRWDPIYRIPEHGGWNDIGIEKPELSPPVTWFEWSFTLTGEGMEHSTEVNTPYAVCDPLEPGTYRFVYWGVTTSEERVSDWETEYAIGVEFRVTE